MNHQGTIPLQTQRLTLRRYTMADAPAMYRNWASDPEVTRYLTWQPHRDLAVSQRTMSAWVESYANPAFYLWAIVPRGRTEPIGTISVVELNEETEAAEIGYCIGKKWWHQGYVAEAFRAVMAYLFRTVGVQRICAAHDTENPNSGAVMRKCGLRLEGILRQGDRNNRGIVDAALYSILRREFDAPPQEKSCGAVVLIRTAHGPRYVLVQSHHGVWGFPKGHMEPGETEHDTALREIWEEVGLRPQLLRGFREINEYTLPGTNIRKEVVYFLAESPRRRLRPQAEELRCARLVTLEQGLSLLRHPAQRQVLARAHLCLLEQAPERPR